MQTAITKIDNRTSDLVSGTVTVTAGANVDVKNVSKQNKIAHLFINGTATQHLYANGTPHFQVSIPPVGYQYFPLYIRTSSTSRIQLILMDTSGKITLSGDNIAAGETFTIVADYSCN